MMQTYNMRRYWFYFGITLIIIGLSFSRAFVSFGQAALALTFLFDKNFITKIKNLAKNKAFLASISFYALLWVTLLYTDNYNEGLFDLRTKVPLLLFPLVFATESPISFKVFKRFMLLFAVSVTISLTYSLSIYYLKDISDFRDAFLFVSHIRMSLEALIAISFFLYLAADKESDFPLFVKLFFVIISVYLIWVMISLELLTGIVIAFLIGLLFLIKLLLQSNKGKLIWAFASLVFVFLIISFVYISSIVNSYSSVKNIDLNKLEVYSPLGNKYTHNPTKYQIENGNYIGIYIQWDEMKAIWNQRSEFDFEGKDKRGQTLRYTLLRYLNSKHLRKDAAGANSLSDEDIANVEKGIANYEYTKRFSIKKRIFKLLWELDYYKRGAVVSGHTIVQRLELWRNSIAVIKENPILGSGIGDIREATNQVLIKNKSSLAGSKLKSHNEFISALVSSGFLGLFFLLFSLFYPPIYLKKFRGSLYFYFFAIMLFSMLWEDTLGTMVGVTLYAFFNAVFLFGIEDMPKKGIK
ncbi:MAG: hypothetical protein DRI86_01995 [Bacteroidetes bacterium]|nr:MAG: hypothetical protein DRI86_01995 [Bacteroidota bacterium]